MASHRRKPTAVYDAATKASTHENYSENHINTTQSPTADNKGFSMTETGVIEKLLRNYGFIQSTTTDSRYFFHCSAYSGGMESLAIGDNVSFQTSFDKRTGRPIATSVEKLSGSSNDYEQDAEQCLTGTIAQLVDVSQFPSDNHPKKDLGYVKFNSKGVHYFLPFSLEDLLQKNTQLQVGDEIKFSMVTDSSSGNGRATKIAPKLPNRYQGVVCSMKESFGFIERADVVEEIFFHYSEFQGSDINKLQPGDDVEFGIKVRNKKDVAVEIVKLPPGTVIFDDVLLDTRRGKILEVFDQKKSRTDPLSGCIVYETASGSIEIPYGADDQASDYTLLENDIVDFNIATDRRDLLQRATNISLIEDTFIVNKEKRETGEIVAVRDGYGFIECPERNGRIFFRFNEFLDGVCDATPLERVRFTVIADPAAAYRQLAVRIKRLPNIAAISHLKSDVIQGIIVKEAPISKACIPDGDTDTGLITYEKNGKNHTILYLSSSVIGDQPKLGVRVEFKIAEITRNGIICYQAAEIRPAFVANKGTRMQATKMFGFVACINKDYGYIESAEHDRATYFNCKNVKGAYELKVGDEVEFTVSNKASRVSAENVEKLPLGTVAPEELLDEECEGIIVRCMRIVNSLQAEYSGLVCVVRDGINGAQYPYGITSLVDKTSPLKIDDNVRFQLCKVKSTGVIRATNIVSLPRFSSAKVCQISENKGVLDYEVQVGRKLSFSLSDVADDTTLNVGDTVEFVVVRKNQKFIAINVRKTVEKRAPERLRSRLKSCLSEDGGPKVIVIRQPRGPDNTSGFSQPRVLRSTR